MTAEDRIRAIADFGFTERQARFLVTVMLHSGVCLLRQYTAFAGIVHGQKTRKFFYNLVSRGYATAYACRHNRGRVYHIHHKPLYRAIGATDSRHRRPMSAACVVENLTLLDALLTSPEVVWLATDDERETHLSGVAGITPEEAVRLTANECSKHRPSRHRSMQIGIDSSGRWLFVYVVTADQLNDLQLASDDRRIANAVLRDLESAFHSSGIAPPSSLPNVTSGLVARVSRRRPASEARDGGDFGLLAVEPLFRFKWHNHVELERDGRKNGILVQAKRRPHGKPWNQLTPTQKKVLRPRMSRTALLRYEFGDVDNTQLREFRWNVLAGASVSDLISWLKLGTFPESVDTATLVER